MSREDKNIPFLHRSVLLSPLDIFSPKNLKYVRLETLLDTKKGDIF